MGVKKPVLGDMKMIQSLFFALMEIPWMTRGSIRL